MSNIRRKNLKKPPEKQLYNRLEDVHSIVCSKISTQINEKKKRKKSRIKMFYPAILKTLSKLRRLVTL